MRSLIIYALLLGAAVVLAPVTPANAGDGVHAKSGPRVKGHVHQWGPDHCYNLPDPDERYLCQFAGFIDPQLDKQTPAGPFDSGFWFDSGIGQNGGDSPYMN